MYVVGVGWRMEDVEWRGVRERVGEDEVRVDRIDGIVKLVLFVFSWIKDII